MQEIGQEEYRQAKLAKESLENLSSFSPLGLPPHHTRCKQPNPAQRRDDEFHAQRFLPCHYFDLICGSSTGR